MNFFNYIKKLSEKNQLNAMERTLELIEKNNRKIESYAMRGRTNCIISRWEENSIPEYLEEYYQEQGFKIQHYPNSNLLRIFW